MTFISRMTSISVIHFCLLTGEVIDEVGDDTLFDPLSPDAVGYSDQDELQVRKIECLTL